MKAIMVVDMLNDSIVERNGYRGKAAVPGTENIIGNIERILTVARSKEILIIYANDCHEKDSSKMIEWIERYGGKEHCVKGTYGAEVVEELKPMNGDLILTKEDFSVFTNENAERLLQARRITEIYVTGVAIAYCVKASVLDAIDLGYKVNLVVDAITGIDFVNRGDQSKALLKMGHAGVKPKFTSEVLEELVEKE